MPSTPIPNEVIRAVNLIDEVMARVPVGDWHDEFKVQIEDSVEVRDCLETVHKILLEMPGWAHLKRVG